MTANELISSYKNSDLDSEQIEVWCEEAVELLRQQAKEIEQLKLRQLSDEEIKECCKKVGVIIHVEYLPSWIKELSDELIKASSVGTRARLSCS